jgi:hypothetical protein
MEDERIRRECGRLSLSPPEGVVAGSYCTWELTYTVGRIGMDDGSKLKIAVNQTSDWGPPQFEDPTAEDYCSVETDGDATVEGTFDPQGHVRPYRNTITVRVSDGSLAEGEEITLTLGDRSAGSMGLQAQSYPETTFELIGLVDAFETGEPVELPDRPAFEVVPGPAESLAAVAPAEATTGEPVTVKVRGADFWGNAATGYEGSLTLGTEGEDETDDEILVESVSTTDGVAQVDVQFDAPGVKRVTVRDDDRSLEAATNPIVVHETPPDRRVRWGDIHGQSEETVGTGSVEEYFAYAKEKAFLEFASHAGNDFQITDDLWERIQDAVSDFHDPGEFVTFLCYEWSANTPSGGDHNVYFRGEEAEIHRSSNWQVNDGPEQAEGTYPIEELYDQYEGRDDVLIIPHQGGRPARVRDVIDSELTPFVEILSVWGIFEWFGEEALGEKHVGFVAGSDDHTGRPGASYPANVEDWSFPIKGGLMAAEAESLSREALWDAFEDRRVYGTTGARIFLDASVDGVGMGGAVSVDGSPEIDVTAHGTAPIGRIDLFRDGEQVATRSFGGGPERFELEWTGARSKDRHKVLDWSGGLSVQDGRIEGVEEFGFDHPEEGVTDRRATHLRWAGSTAGNYQGLRLDLAGEDPTLSFNAKPLTATLDPGDQSGPRTIDAGHLDAALRTRHVEVSTERDVEARFVDDDADSDGESYYYVRVRQVDGEMAWSSPIAVDRE